MTLSNEPTLHRIRHLGQVAMVALCLGAAAGALIAMPLGNIALAKSDHDNGNHGGGNGNGGGNGHGNGGGNGNGHGGDDGKGKSDTAGVSGPSTDSLDQFGDDDASLAPSGLGKLNGFFHASPNALAHASPNSSIGKIAQTFRDALSAFAAANSDDTDDPDGTDTTDAPTTDDLGAILAGATNKPVTAAQVHAIAERLAEVNPDDPALADFADAEDDDTFQDIADAANGAPSDDDATDTSSSETN